MTVVLQFQTITTLLISYSKRIKRIIFFRPQDKSVVPDEFAVSYIINMSKLCLSSQGMCVIVYLEYKGEYKISKNKLNTFFIFQVIGPKFMENRKPYELKNVLIVYNFLQVIFSAWLFYEVFFSLI